MPFKIGYSSRDAGQTLYAVLVSSSGQYWSVVENQFVTYSDEEVSFEVYFDVSQYSTRTGGPYAGIQNNLVWEPSTVVQAPLGINTLYSTDDVSQMYINRGAGTGDHDLVPLYNNWYNGDQTLIYDMISNVSDWLDVYVPDGGFTGIIVLDFERPLIHDWLTTQEQDDWTDDTYNNAGEAEYDAWTEFVVNTIVTEIRSLRPNARLGWYDWPPYAPAGSDYYGSGASAYDDSNDIQVQIDLQAWLPTLMDVILPSSGYLLATADSATDNWGSGHITVETQEDYVSAPITEVKRLLAHAGISRPIYLYVWARYATATLGYAMIADYDLSIILERVEAQEIDGMIMWQGFGPDDAYSLDQFADYEEWIANTWIPTFFHLFSSSSSLATPLTESGAKYYSAEMFLNATDGQYSVRVYEQVGDEPDLANDTLLQVEPFLLKNNEEHTLLTPVVVSDGDSSSEDTATINKIWQEVLRIASKVRSR